MTTTTPRISILMATLNAAQFLREAVESVIRQSFTEWELVVNDGGSRDGTLEILAALARPNIRVFSEPDENYNHALSKGFQRCRGDYITIMQASDGYLDRDWLRLCVEALDADSEASLTWGIPATRVEDGPIGGAHSGFAQFLGDGNLPGRLFHLVKWKYRHWIPQKVKRRLYYSTLRLGAGRVQKRAWLPYWLDTALIFPDGNLCCRRGVYAECMPAYEVGSHVPDQLYDFFFNFNCHGYLPLCIPRIANFGRTHKGQLTEVHGQDYRARALAYSKSVRDYGRELRERRSKHLFRDGSGTVIGEWEPSA